MLLPEAGAIYVVDRAFSYVDFARLYVLHQAGPSSSAHRQSPMMLISVYSAPTDRSIRHHLRPDHLPGRPTPVRITPNFCGASSFKDPESRQDGGLHLTNNLVVPADHLRAHKSRWQVELFFKWIKQRSSDQAVLRHVGERLKTQICDLPSRSTLVAIVKKRLDLDASTLCYRILLGDPLRENAHASSTCGRRKQMQRFANNATELNLFDF